MRFKQRVTMLTGAVAIGVVGIVLPASASASTLYVSNSTPTVSNGKSCAQPGFRSIQAALQAGGTNPKVAVCPGTYTEQLEITKPAKLEAVGGIGTATLVMPASAVNSKTSCDTMGGLEQKDEVSICTSGTVSLTNLNIQAIVPTEGCGGELYGIFVGEGGTLKATGLDIDGASTSISSLKGCQYGVAVEIGNKTPAEIGHGVLKNDTVHGYQKNGPTAKSPGSTLSISGSTITGEGPSPYISQNGVEVAYGAEGNVKSSTISGNECNVAVCSTSVEEQATGVLFYESASGSNVTSSTLTENDLGAYYASASAAVPATPAFTLSKDVLTGNRYEGVVLEEGKAALKSDVINGTGRVGIDLLQRATQASASESSATSTKVEGQTESAVKVESDKAPGDKQGRFTFSKGTFTGDGTVLLNESGNFEVIF